MACLFEGSGCWSGGRDQATCSGREVRRVRSVQSTGDGEKGGRGTQQVVCFSVRDETRALDLEGWRKK